MGAVLLFYAQQAAPSIKSGSVVLPITFGRVVQSAAAPARVAQTFTFGMVVGGVKPASTSQFQPSIAVDIGFTSPPLTASPAWTDVSARARGISTKRGRSYEFDRMETGTTTNVLSNRDSALSPANTSSPYNPVKSNRPYRVRFIWDKQTYPAWRGISEGYPQAYPSLGQDALVELHGNDLFYALNRARFSPGSTILASPLEVVPQNTEETITVASTALPMPQSVPFTITVAGVTEEWPSEDMVVEEILGPTTYRVTRSQETTWEHPASAAVTTDAVSFGQAFSGERIRQVLERVGFGSDWYDLDEGQSLIAASEDLANVNPLEHINLMAECEFGRFFVSREGKFTFRDRHAAYVDNLTPVATFTGGDITPAASDVPYKIEGALEHSEEKLYNHVRITIPSGEVVEMRDEASIEDHFIGTFEREWPYARLNDAESAARYILSNSSEDTVRIPELEVSPAHNPSLLWPLLLARELGERFRFRYQPEGGGSVYDKHLIIEGISHGARPGDHKMRFQGTEVAPTQYWVLGRTDYSELGSTTRVGF